MPPPDLSERMNTGIASLIDLDEPLDELFVAAQRRLDIGRGVGRQLFVEIGFQFCLGRLVCHFKSRVQSRESRAKLSLLSTLDSCPFYSFSRSSGI